MQRNMELIRRVLLNLESNENEFVNDLEIDNISNEELIHHLRIMQEADLIDCDFQGTSSGRYLLKYARLTWQGHDFLSKIKNETVWQKTKAKFKDTLSAMPFSLLSDVALELCKNAIENKN